MNNGNVSNGLADLFDDLMSGRKTVEQIKVELKDAKIYLRAGKNYRELKFNGFARINGVSANVYIADEKIDAEGTKVVPTPRTPKPSGTGKGRK
jgi:hypothetical protein